MCGIFACIFCGEGLKPCLKEKVLTKLKRRGPDCTNEINLRPCSTDLRLDLVGTLLRMRGLPTPQPLLGEVESGAGACRNYLLWNGNIFGGDIQIAPEENDTVQLLRELLVQDRNPSGVLTTLRKIHGPWAFIYWQESTRSLWFGRDTFGRRSLLWHIPSTALEEGGLFALSSVGHYHEQDMPLGYWTEVPASGIYCIQFGVPGQPLLKEFCCYPWMQGEGTYQSESTVREELLSLHSILPVSISPNKTLQVPFPPLNKFASPPPTVPSIADTTHKPLAVSSFEIITSASNQHSVDVSTSTAHGMPPASGNLDSKPLTSGPHMGTGWLSLAKQFLSILMRAVHARVIRAPFIPTRLFFPMDDLHPPVPKGIEGSASNQSRLSKSPPAPTVVEKQFQTDLKDTLFATSQTPESGYSVLPCKQSLDMGCPEVVQGKARIGVLFSGGVDSAVLAALTDRCLGEGEEIDLINVAFEQKSASAESKCFNVPDRVSAIQCLCELNPSRKWNLIMVNVTLEEVTKMRKERVSHMVYPLNTVLDDSIGCALWFAAKGDGLLYSDLLDHTPNIPYHSQARALLVGIGADEQLAGYSRHRTKFKSLGWDGLVAELDMDIKRLSRRNLGRDDRCIADHQREGQFPYLDEDVVSFLQRLPVWQKTDLTLQRGEGEKRLLREVSRLLGCHRASQLPKKAIQFGSRMAKLAGSTNNREQGSSACVRLLPGGM